jgi:gamma-carbonic anhydrase
MAIIKSYQGKYPRIHPSAFIAENATIIGDVTIEAGASIWYGCVLRADVASIHIGEYSNIQDGTVIHVASLELGGQKRPTRVGAYVTVGHMALLHACTLEDESFVGMQSCVMDGTLVKTHGMLGAGSLLSPGKVVKTDTLWLGRPAKFQRALSCEEQAFFKHSAEFYYHLSRHH